MLSEEMTKKITGSTMEVHKRLGNGFQELMYQRALEIEMNCTGLTFAWEMEIPVHYCNTEIGTRRVDFFVEKRYW
jgi:GxxExxY protein